MIKGFLTVTFSLFSSFCFCSNSGTLSSNETLDKSVAIMLKGKGTKKSY